MMDVPIEDEHATRTVNALRLAGRDDRIVENAESHPLVRHGMVTRRADQGIRGAHGAGHDGVHSGDRATGGQSRDAISAAADRGARAGIPTVGLSDLGHPRQMLRRVIDGQLLVGGESWIDSPHPIRDPVQVHEMFRAADESRARWVRDRFGEWIQGAIRDQVETGVMGQITVVKDKTDETVSWHRSLQLDQSQRYKGLTLRPMPSITFQNVMNVDQS